MNNERYHNYLLNLGYSKSEISSFLYGNIFDYSPKNSLLPVKYIFTRNDEEIFDHQLRLWNRNVDNVFVAVGEEKTHIVDCKRKPLYDPVLSIKSFDYGINTEGFENIDIDLITKSHVDSSLFFQFVQEKQIKKQAVDKHLLLNLIALRDDLLSDENERVVHKVILRCLFVKYLEDRGIIMPNSLTDILASNKCDKLIEAFGEVSKINGDVFGDNRLEVDDIRKINMEKLYLFFTSDYQSGQGTLFPYKFDIIPIQLISHVYEAFLNSDKRRGKGIYYTPPFVVKFMLSESLKREADKNPNLTVFDPAVGSAAFLVESFKIIRDAKAKSLGSDSLSFDQKKEILKRQLWGVDVDEEALQISAFSLYLALLEDESADFIQKKIKHSHPILPSLIGNTLILANTITDPVFEGRKFDFIVSNPPWGSIPNDNTHEHLKERLAIENKSGAYPEYSNVSDYERSQAFLMRIGQWQKPETTTVMIVKNSIFLNVGTADFRKEFISKNKLETFFELSDYNKILFKKKKIQSPRVKIEIGASEPCVVLIFKPHTDNSIYIFNYVSPKLTKLGEHFEIIQYTSIESFQVCKQDVFENDELWRILVNSDLEGYNLIKKKIIEQKDFCLEVRTGFQPKKNMKPLGEPLLKEIITPSDFEAYRQKATKLGSFNWNQELHRKRKDESIYSGSRIILPVRPLKKDKLKLRAIHLEKEVVFKNNILCLRIKDAQGFINCFPYLSIINSKLMGFYVFNTSSQWGKGPEKRESLKNVELETMPIKKIPSPGLIDTITNILTSYIHERNEGRDGLSLLNELDEIVYNLYGLTDYEKEIVNEFYQVNVERASDILRFVKPSDIEAYFETFKETFELVLSPNHALNASFYISPNIGSIIKITIVDSFREKELEQDNTLQLLQFVKDKQLKETDKLLKEEKVKLYEPTHFYLVKSNKFKDWTKRQAYKDAKEEIDFLLSNLPDTHE